MTNHSSIITILNLAITRIMKKTRITITHQLEKTQHHFVVVNPVKLNSSEVNEFIKTMGVEMVFLNGELYK